MPNPNPHRENLKHAKPGQRGADNKGGRKKGAKNLLTRERVEQELRYIAFSDPLSLFDRVHKGRRVFRLRELDAMPQEMRRCIASVKVRTENLTAGDNEQDSTVEVKLWDKTKALELCARSLGMLTDNVRHTVDEALLARLDAGKVRRRALKEDGE